MGVCFQDLFKSTAKNYYLLNPVASQARQCLISFPRTETSRDIPEHHVRRSRDRRQADRNPLYVYGDLPQQRSQSVPTRGALVRTSTMRGTAARGTAGRRSRSTRSTRATARGATTAGMTRGESMRDSSASRSPVRGTSRGRGRVRPSSRGSGRGGPVLGRPASESGQTPAPGILYNSLIQVFNVLVSLMEKN